MMYLGDFDLSKTVRFMWNTFAVAGESITRATDGTISVYKDGGITQSTAGVTDTENFDGLTGVHSCAIDTSADGTFYSAGSEFAVVLSGAVIDGKTINSVLAHFSLRNRSAVMPTTAGRTLDVSAGGEAGVDWANVGSPTTTLNLSGTTVKTATDVETDTQDIQGRIPAALVSGRMDSNMQAAANGVITAAAIADNAIDAAAIASDAITAAKIATGAITAAKFAAGAIDAAAIATDAIDNDAIAASAVTEIQSGLSTLTAAQVNAEVDTAIADVGLTATITGRIDAAVSTRATPAQVNTEVLDVLTVDTFAEPSAVPAATSTLKDKINWLFALARNKRTTTGSLDTLRNDADNSTIATAVLSDDATTFTRAEYS